MVFACGKEISDKLEKNMNLLTLGESFCNLGGVLDAKKQNIDLSDKYHNSISKVINYLEKSEKFVEDSESYQVMPRILEEGEWDIAMRYFIIGKENPTSLKKTTIKIRDRKMPGFEELNKLETFCTNLSNYCLKQT